MEMQQKTARRTTVKQQIATPICFALQSSHEASQACLATLENIILAHPDVTVAVEAIRDLDRRAIEFVVSVLPPLGQRWDEPTPALLEMFGFMENLLMKMHGYLPSLTERPDEEDRATVARFAAQGLSPIVSTPLAA